ncbi:sensor histidine kinase [Flavobacterium urocaniciphilum]|uniref:histidine kinase n=1 Tax=Flavobacterium urocaniciphilum TaxID=1299341 RepID=A0A1H9E2I6_9FLAO|nr:sensor histidine kinase [Flavobacterium urocaniciphilum]SEQ19901.1 Signal transduction histidine kinase [Flavobacterium urocaniciphilum]
MKLKKFILLLIVNLLIFSCKKENHLITYNKIDTLLVKANNDFLNKKVRLAYIDSVSLILSNLKSDSLYNYYRFKLANRYYNLNLFEQYKSLTLQINKEAIEKSDTLTLAKCNYNLGGYYYEKYNLDSSFYYYNKAKNLSLNLKEIKLKVEIHKDLGRALFYHNQFLESEKNTSIALKDAKKLNHHEYIFECYTIFGLSQSGMKNYSKAIEYFNEANKVLVNLKNDSYYPVLYAQNLINFCDVYKKKKDYTNLFKFSERGLHIKNLKQLEINTYTYLLNFHGYAKLKKNDKNSIKEFQEALKIGDSLDFQPIQNTSNLYIGEYYLSQKDTGTANIYFKKVKETKFADDKLKALEKLTITEPKNPAHLKQIISLKDSLFSIERLTRDKFARIEYETNEIISEKETIEKQKDNIVQQLWSVSTIAVFIILAVLLFYFIKSRNLKNKELIFIQEQQNAKEEIYELMLNQQQRIEEGKYSEKNRISQELHDGVMGKLTGIRLNLFILKKKQDVETVQKCLPFIDDIQNIEKEIRQITHDLKQNLFDDNITFSSIVENLFIMIKSHSDIDFSLQIDERIDWDLINNNKKINIYRIIQEALQNIDKYAQASKVNINMNKMGEEIHITITDNGIGFVPKHGKKGIGLENMQARMDEINGKFELESKINFGTKISLTFQI